MKKTDEKYTAWGIGEGIHEATGLKPMLTSEEQVTLLKSKGVTFERCSEDEAISALTERDTFLHITSYRKLFQKHQEGEKTGQYVRLDFADLVALDELDAELRSAFQSVAYDIERLAKTKLVERISANPEEDGYGIVADFMESQQKRYRNTIESNLRVRMQEDAYTGQLIENYADAMPVWVFLEVASFGALLAFYLFCAERWDDEPMRQEHYAMKGVKSVRNCCSHGSCIINGFDDSHEANFRVSSITYEWLDAKEVGSSRSRRSKMHNRRIQHLLETLVMFNRMDCRPSSSHSVEGLTALKNSLGLTCKGYGDQNVFVSYLRFLAKLIDKAL